MAEKCPTCQSPDPKHHPAVQFEGEVHLCRDTWHKPTAEELERHDKPDYVEPSDLVKRVRAYSYRDAFEVQRLERELAEARMDFEGRKASEEFAVRELNRLHEELSAARCTPSAVRPTADRYRALLREIDENALLGAHGMTSEEMATLREALRMASSTAPHEGYATVDIVFDGPPGHESGRFVEVESPQGTGIKFGRWVHRDDGYWALRFTEALVRSATTFKEKP